MRLLAQCRNCGFRGELRHAFRRYYWRSQWRNILQHLGLWPRGHEYEWRRIHKRHAKQQARERRRLRKYS